jgi:thiamine transporter ThiT
MNLMINGNYFCESMNQLLHVMYTLSFMVIELLEVFRQNLIIQKTTDTLTKLHLHTRNGN